MTYRELLNQGVAALQQAGLEGARDDARFLLFAAAGFSSSDFIMHEADDVGEDVQDRFQGMIARRLAREPVSLILGTADFMGLTFKTDERALAPRADSERLVEEVLSRSEAQATGKIVDLGTGSGCLLQSFLHYRPGWTGTAVDLSADALSLARENAENLGLTKRIAFLEGSWDAGCAAISEADIVISNPPYIVSDVMASLDPEVLNHDPHLALDGGADGLDAYRAITSLCERNLRSGHLLAFEIGFDQGEAVKSLMNGHGFAELTIQKDFSGHDRVVVGIKR